MCQAHTVPGVLTGASHILCVFGPALSYSMYIFTICTQQSIYMHANIIEYIEARGPLYKWQLCHYRSPTPIKPQLQ